VLGYEPDEMQGLRATDLIHPDDIPGAEAGFLRLGPGQPTFQINLRLRRKSGEFIWCEHRYRHLPDDDSVLLISRDITASKLAEDRLAATKGKLEAANIMLQQQAQHDALTGLPNRRQFDERLAEAFQEAQRNPAPVGLVMIDVDCFKAYNDLYGHLEGDTALRRLSLAIKGLLRRASDLAARYGGEELVVLLPGSDAHGTLVMAQRICHCVAALSIEHLGNPHGCVTVSAGASAVMPGIDTDDPTQLICAADRALYAAKADGRNRVRSTTVKSLALPPSDARRPAPVPTLPKREHICDN
jgi:diguanylate cyclase (GGDEF)-like protein